MTSAVAVGVFDGLHLGHRRILDRALGRAHERGGRCVVVSFDPHPDVVLSKSFQPAAPLTPHAERRRLLTEMGVEIYEVIPFTRELASLEPEDFVTRYLIEPFQMRDLVVGQNFALGRGRSGDVPRLERIGVAEGFAVEAVPLVLVDGEPVSSSRIRALLAEGRVAEVARLLGRRFALAGLVVRGSGMGRALGCPTANLRLHDEQALPAEGIYAAWARIDGETAFRPAAMSIGVRPTFGDNPLALEAHLLGWDGDLVGQDLIIEFADWIRAQRTFEGPEALAAAMREDVRTIGQRLERAGLEAV